MSEEKINISWDELKSSKIEKQVKQQQAMANNRKYARMTSADLPEADEKQFSFASIFYNEIVYLSIFGLLGGLLAWGAGTLLHLRQDPREEAEGVIRYVQQIEASLGTEGGVTAEQLQINLDNIRRTYSSNAYITLFLDPKLTDQEKDRQKEMLAQRDAWKATVEDVLAFGLCGMAISICLTVAEPIVDRNIPKTVINGSVGALVGLLGGLVASTAVDRVYQLVISGEGHSHLRHLLAPGASWAVLGSLICFAPGITSRSFKRLIIGILGGAIGGLVGGLLFNGVTRVANFETSRLVGLVCIGVVAGIFTGILDQVTRTGWLKVTSGLIAGKQFILYRNPTYLGSSPDCQIYLFKDPEVGKRHAAIHVLKGRFELEDLPLGSATLINGEAITRKKLRNGDKIKIGATSFVFQEKSKE